MRLAKNVSEKGDVAGPDEVFFSGLTGEPGNAATGSLGEVTPGSGDGESEFAKFRRRMQGVSQLPREQRGFLKKLKKGERARHSTSGRVPRKYPLPRDLDVELLSVQRLPGKDRARVDVLLRKAELCVSFGMHRTAERLKRDAVRIQHTHYVAVEGGASRPMFGGT